ncbi:MAG: nucleotide sugar dehydrogenase [Opitutae bacterium]|nr:nucleotide sugar dehydrogenase [Opitutae bacterium]
MKITRPSFEQFTRGEAKIAIIGLGYVGLPLAAVFSRKFKVIGFDINERRVKELREGHDRTRELSREQLKTARGLTAEDGGQAKRGGKEPVRPKDARAQRTGGLEFSTDPKVLSQARLIIVTVPTPIDNHKNPDLTPLIKASTMIGRHIQPGTTVVYESTVYPGCTEEDCLPLIEKESGLKWKQDFFAGYSPERINPGDKEHTVDKIKKVVSGDTADTAEMLKQIYGAVITAGIFVAASIKTAEAAKVIENTQRDLNIALMNELALIFDRMGIRTLDVLEAAGTKWNFLPFRPGLVGGHCIGVDPYYLTFKAESLGYHPQVILAGRRINDGMGKFIAEKTVKLLIANDRPVKGAKVLILGWTFKEDVPDIRNTRVIDIYRELESYYVNVSCYDPHADVAEVKHEYGIELLMAAPRKGPFDAVILAVKHRSLFAAYPLEIIQSLGGSRPPVVIDVKGFLARGQTGFASAIWQL